MHKSFDKKSKNLKPLNQKTGNKTSNKRLKENEDDSIPPLKSDVLEKPKKKVHKKFFFDDDEEISYRIKH